MGFSTSSYISLTNVFQIFADVFLKETYSQNIIVQCIKSIREPEIPMNHKESLIILMERPAENEFPGIILNLWEYLQSAGRRLQKCLEIGCWVSFFPPAMFSPTRRRLTLRRTNRERGAKSANRHLG